MNTTPALYFYDGEGNRVKKPALSEAEGCTQGSTAGAD